MRALVLSGGGVKGAFQVGVIKELLEHEPDLDYDIYTGISVGALNSSLLATDKLDKSFPDIENIWLNKIDGNHSIWSHNLYNYIVWGIVAILVLFFIAFMSFLLGAAKWITVLLFLAGIASFYLPYHTLTHSHSIYKTSPLRKLVKEGLDVNKLRNSGKQIRIGAASFTTGEYRSVGAENENIIEWIMASSAFPIFFPMEKIDGEYWTDGGVINIAPLGDAIALGATDVDIILTGPIENDRFNGEPGLIKQFMRNMDVLSTEIIRNDLMLKCKNINVRVFIPEKTLTSNSLEFDPVKIKAMYEYGRRLARKNLNDQNIVS